MSQNTMFRLNMLSIFTKCMFYLYVIKNVLVCLFQIQIKWILLSFKSQTPYLISNQSDLKRLYNIIMTYHIINVGNLHVRQKATTYIILSYIPVSHPQQQIHTLLMASLGEHVSLSNTFIKHNTMSSLYIRF